MIYIVASASKYDDAYDHEKYSFVLMPDKYRTPEWTKIAERLLLTDFYELGLHPSILGTTVHDLWREGSVLRAFADFIGPPLFIGWDASMKTGSEYLGPMEVPKWDREGSSTRTVWAKSRPALSRVPQEFLRLLYEDWRAIDNEHNRAYFPIVEVLLTRMEP